MQLTHLGHACLLVETETARLLIDPGMDSSFADVRDLDAVLVTHQHPDHIDVDRTDFVALRESQRDLVCGLRHGDGNRRSAHAHDCALR